MLVILFNMIKNLSLFLYKVDVVIEILEIFQQLKMFGYFLYKKDDIEVEIKDLDKRYVDFCFECNEWKNDLEEY